MRAIWHDTVMAESDNTLFIQGNHYFPPESVNKEYLRGNDTHTICQVKGLAYYYDLVVGEETVTDAAWYYPDPKASHRQIKDHVAFDKSKGFIVRI